MNRKTLLTIRIPTERQWMVGAFLFILYFAATAIGSLTYFPPATVSAAAGIALAGLVLEGTALWPAIYLASLAGYLFFGSGHLELLVGIILPIAATAQAVVGALLLKKLRFDPLLNHLRDVTALFLVALIISMITPTLGMIAYYLNHVFFASALPPAIWGAWWGSIIVSILIVSPFAIRWFEYPRFTRTRDEIKEIFAAFSFLILLNFLTFWTSIGAIGGISLLYFLLIPFFWIALRIGPRFLTLATIITTASALGSIFLGPFASTAAGADIGSRLFQMEMLMLMIAGIFLILVSIEEERKDALRGIKSQVIKLEGEFGNLSFQDRAKSEFLAILAHELRNPLAPMVSSIEFLRLKGLVQEEGMLILDQVDDRIKTIKRLLDDILDISRISQNKLRLQKEYVELQSVIARAIQSVEKTLESRRQTLSINIAGEPIPLNADTVRIEQVLTNLLNNASKYTHERGRISLSARERGGVAEIEVRDNGIGIEQNMLERIFEPFLQIEGKQTNEGLGIGLSLTRRLVEMHEGTIEAKSKGRGYGSEFIVRIPAFIPPEQEDAVANPAEFPQRPNVAHRVLVVDDNSAAAHSIGRLLEYMGYLVDYAYSGGEAVKKTMQSYPDSIVLDIGLPDMDGYETARTIRSKAGFTGILIALTGYGQEEDKQKAFAAGFDHHLTKPVGIADLQTILIEPRSVS